MDTEKVQKINTVTYSSNKNSVKQIKDLEYKVKENDHIKSVFNKSNTSIVSCILQFLEFKDISEFQHTNKYFQKLLSNKKILREYALSGVMDTENRLIFYETLINIQEIKLKLRDEIDKYNIKSNIYNNILRLANDLKDKDEKFSYVHQQISKDLNRTFYTGKFKEGNGKEQLYNILIAIAFIRPEIGYCQGMNFIVGALINFINSEEKCFWIFLYFIDNIGLKTLYLQNVPDYLIKLYQLNYFINEEFPLLLPHLNKKQISPDIFFSKWILTIFSNYLPFETLYNVWDLFIIDKWKAIFKFSIIIVNYMKDKLMNLDIYSFSPYLRNNANINLLKFSQMSKYYNDYKISKRKLEELKENFYVEDLKRKLENSNYSKWTKDENIYIMNYQYELNQFIINIKKPVEILEQQISYFNLECDKKSKKYYEKLSVVNDLKLKLEQEIEVKTKYEKILKQLLNTRDINTQKKINDNIYSNKMNEKDFSPISRTFRKNETERIQKSGISNKRKIKFSFNLKKIISRNSNDYDKIIKKLNSVNKEIDKNNKVLLIEYQKLDKRQNNLNEAVNQRDELKKQLDNILNSSEMMKRELIKELFHKLNSI